MEVIVERCADLDAHQGTITASIRWAGPAGECEQTTRSFATTHHAFLVSQFIAHLDYLDETIVATLSNSIEGQIAHYRNCGDLPPDNLERRLTQA